jgi:uncharacterized membrane protein YeaQ/YmgE (transglycosylase-associated protein family)
MPIFELFLYLVLAGLSAALVRVILGGTSAHFVVSILMGFLGAFLVTWLARILKLPALVPMSIADHPFPIVWAALGSLFLVILSRALTKPPRHVSTVR